jgi:DNA-directed RNA polymerase subunit L
MKLFGASKPKESFTEAEKRPRHSLETVSTPEQFLETIDFKTLNTIFDEIARKAGVVEDPAHPGHRIDEHKIKFIEEISDSSGDLVGRANVTTGVISIKWTNDLVPGDSIETAKLLTTLAHEATHIRGNISHKTFPHPDLPTITAHVSKIGLREQVTLESGKKYFPGGNHGLSLNEAVTEELGIEVLTEYLKRTGNSAYLEDPEVVEIITEGAYISDRRVLGLVIQTLSKNLDVPTSIIWQSMVREYMSGETGTHTILNLLQEALMDDEEIRSMAQMLVTTHEPLDNRFEKSQSESDLSMLDTVNDFYRSLPEEKRRSIHDALGLR